MTSPYPCMVRRETLRRAQYPMKHMGEELSLAIWNGACGRTHDGVLSSVHPPGEHQAASNV